MKKCIIVSDSFKGSISSLEICAMAQESIGRLFPGCQAVPDPVADGGEGTVDCFLQAIQAEPVTCDVTGPYGEAVQAVYCRAGDRAVMEMAAAAGLPMVDGRLDPAHTTTYGVGQMIRHAVEQGCTEILLGLGGSCTNDGGCGCAAALGTRFLRADGSAFVPVGAELDQIARIDRSETEELLKGVRVAVMCDVDNPLYGPRGAAHVFGPQKGADRAMVELLDGQLMCFDQILARELGRSVSQIPGAGAAGGMGAGCIAFLGAELKPGIEAVLDMVDFDRSLEGADLVITGEGRIDSQSIHGKVISGVARRVAPKKIPLVAVVGGIADGAEGAYELGVSALFGCDRESVGYQNYAHKAKENYQRTLEDVLRLVKAVEDRPRP